MRTSLSRISPSEEPYEMSMRTETMAMTNGYLAVSGQQPSDVRDPAHGDGQALLPLVVSLSMACDQQERIFMIRVDVLTSRRRNLFRLQECLFCLLDEPQFSLCFSFAEQCFRVGRVLCECLLPLAVINLGLDYPMG